MLRGTLTFVITSYRRSNYGMPGCDTFRDKATSKAATAWVPNSRAVVCSIHFKEEDYKVGLKRKVLRPTAAPTQFPSYPAYMLPAVSKKRRPVQGNFLSFCAGRFGKLQGTD
ncbi:hypothetical protein HPB50_028163 [Hyalomma asiaticum]|nr:hypothetical protein HPB50_028163 [Hyalomma asiaticum]